MPPPAVPHEPRDRYDAENAPPQEPDPLGRARHVYGNVFEQALRGRVFLDIGCGLGNQVLGAASAGASLSVGVDTEPVYLRMARTYAERQGLTDKVQFTTDSISALGTEWADVALSQNSMEHFDDPQAILAQAYAALKPGGQFFVTFGPSWWHPFGVHNMFMIRLPWVHRVFSERTILRVRQLYRPSKATTWREASLNQMTVKRWLQHVADSGFELKSLSFTPIRPLPRWLVTMRLFREWLTANTSVILLKPAHNN